MTAPLKTALGQEELRQRKRRLSQRHRTVLLLVDGKRRRAEVLALAEKAGVAASFYEELVALGMIEDGRESLPVPLDEPAATAPAALDEPQAAAEPPAAQTGEPAADAAGEPVAAAEPLAIAEPVAADEPVITPAASAAAAPSIAAAPPVEPAPTAPPFEAQVVAVEIAAPLSDEPLLAAAGPQAENKAPDMLSLALPPELPANNRPARARTKFPAPADEPPPFARSSGSLPLLDLPAVLQAPAAAPAPPAPPTRPTSLDASFEAEIDAEARLLAEVRNLLIGTLLIDGPVSGSLIALRVGRARRREDLVALVWEVERSMVRSRRPREAQARLIRARDLLGLGNTLVEDDSELDRDTAW